MGMKFERNKPRNLLASVFYKLDKLVLLPKKTKLRFYLDLEWIMWHLAHDFIYRSEQNLTDDAADDFLVDKIRQDARILDLGCGRGFVAKRLLRKTRNILGIDYNAASIAEARGKFPDSGPEFVCADVFEYLEKNAERRFDVVVLSHILEHLDEPGEFLGRLLAVSDFFYIEVPDFESAPLNAYRQSAGTDLAYNDADHVYEFDRAEMTALIAENNLRIVDSEFKWGVMKFWCRKIEGSDKST